MFLDFFDFIWTSTFYAPSSGNYLTNRKTSQLLQYYFQIVRGILQKYIPMKYWYLGMYLEKVWDLSE